MNYDMTYCANKECKRESCKRHWKRMDEIPKGTLISMAHFDKKNCEDFLEVKGDGF